MTPSYVHTDPDSYRALLTSEVSGVGHRIQKKVHAGERKKKKKKVTSFGQSAAPVHLLVERTLQATCCHGQTCIALPLPVIA